MRTAAITQLCASQAGSSVRGSRHVPPCTLGLWDRACQSCSSRWGRGWPGLHVLWEQGPHRAGSCSFVCSPRVPGQPPTLVSAVFSTGI